MNIEIRRTATYDEWYNSLRDMKAKAKINIRIRRVSLGNFGDVKPVGQGISELRIDYGPGYRIYCKMMGKTLVILLCGGNKSTQSQDIEKAKVLAQELKD